MENLSIEQRLERIENLLLDKKKVLNFNEATIFLNLSKSHLYKLTSSNEIPHYKPNGKRIYFNRVELENWLLRHRIKTNEEIDTEASNYILRNQRKY